MKTTDIEIGTKLELELFNHLGEKRENNFISELEGMDADNIAIIAAPIREGILYPVSVGSKLTAYFILQGQLYMFEGRVITRGKIENIAILKVEVTSNIEKIQRREFFRFDCQLTVKYRACSIDNKGGDPKAPFKKSITRDISGGGLCFLGDEKIEKGQILECELYLDELKAIQFLGEVIRVSKNDDNTKHSLSFGVAYKDIKSTDREAVIGFIFDQQRNLRRKGLI